MIVLRALRLFLLLQLLNITVWAQLTINTYPTSVTPGRTYTITYSPADQIATDFILRKGSSTNLGTVGTIGTGIKGGSFSWTAPSNLASGADYAFQIQRTGSSPNFSGQFVVVDGAAAVSSAAVTPTPTPTPTPVPAATPTPTPTPTPRFTSTAPNTPNAAPSSSTIRSLDATSSPTTRPSSSQRSLDSSAIVDGAKSTSSIASGSSVVSPTSSATGTTSAATNGGLSTRAKAGIGVGVSIAGLLLALGAFFLGMSVHKKSKQTSDVETATSNGKPELEGKAMYRHEVTPEMGHTTRMASATAVAAPTVMTTAQGHDKELYVADPTTQSVELAGPTMPYANLSRELATTSNYHEIETRAPQATYHELHAGQPISRSPVSPIYDHDPRLVQNPWTHDTTPARNR